MASSSVSQESLDMDDFDTSARRNRIRVHRGHSGRGSLPYRTLPDKGDGGDLDKDGRGEHTGENGDHSSNTLGISSHSHLPGGDHESPTRSAAARLKDKRSRANHMKGKLPKDKRKLREKRRSTGVVHCMPSTESTGDSLDDEDDDEDIGVETKKNTNYNESTTTGHHHHHHHHQTLYEARHSSNSSYSPKRGNKSPSDLEADLEDNQDYDSTVSHSETNLTLIGRSESYEASQGLPGRQSAITGLNRKIGGSGAAGSSSSKYSPESRSVFQYGSVVTSPNVGSSGADSPSRTTLSSTSSSSSFFSRHPRESDSPRSLSGANSNNVFGSHGNFSNNNSAANTTIANAGSSTASRNTDPDSPRLVGHNHPSVVGSDSQYHHSLQSAPGGASSYKDSSPVSGVRGDKPQYLSGHLSSSQRFRDSDRHTRGDSGAGSVHSRISSYQSSRPFASPIPSQPPAVVQQQNESIAQLEKMLEKEREDNKRLQHQLEDKDKKIAELEKAIELLNKECDGLDEDNLKLQEENKALIRAMSKLTSNV